MDEEIEEPAIENGGDLRRAFAIRAHAQRLQLDCPGDGVLNAHICIIAEHPGENEVRLKTPLIGGAGKFLWEKLRRHNITRDQCWVTNVIKRIVVRDKTGKISDVSNGEFHHWRELLLWELSKLPNLRGILVLGGPALRAVKGESSIDAWRGTVELKNNIWYAYAHNPANVLRFPQLEPLFMLDLHKFVGAMNGLYRAFEINPRINPSPGEAKNFITQYRDEARQKHQPKTAIAFDIETIAQETACIGFANDSHGGWCLNWRDRNSNRFSLIEEREIRQRLADFLADPAINFVAQNGNFDSYWLWYKDRIRIRRVWFDTMLAHHTLYPTLPHNLGFLTAQYTWHPYYKDEKDTWRENNESIDNFWNYNVKDCCITFEIHKHLLKELKKEKMDHFFFSHVMRLNPHLTRMTVNGILCDVDKKWEITNALREEVGRLRNAFVDAARRACDDESINPNPNSNPQLRALFFERLALIGRGTSIDAENRKRILDHPRTPERSATLIKALDSYATEAKFLSTYAEMEVDDDGRIRCEWKQTGVMKAPGRLSSSQTLWGSGMNLQNQPERAKVMFIADPGYGFVYFDMAQIEARIVGWLAVIPTWIEQFERARLSGGYDAHRALAADMWNMPYDEVPEKDLDVNGKHTKRYIAKRCRHGLNYKMAPDRLATETGLSLSEAINAYTRYHKINPQIQKWWKWVEARARTDHVLYTPLGRRLNIVGRLDDKAIESIVAFVPQSTNGDHVSSVIYKAHDDPDWPSSAYASLNVHDALIIIAPLEERMKCAKILKKYSESPITITGMDNKPRRLIVPAEFGFSQPDEKGLHRWSTIKKQAVK